MFPSAKFENKGVYLILNVLEVIYLSNILAETYYRSIMQVTFVEASLEMVLEAILL